MTGRSGVAQRRFKQDLMKADRDGAGECCVHETSCGQISECGRQRSAQPAAGAAESASSARESRAGEPQARERDAAGMMAAAQLAGRMAGTGAPARPPSAADREDRADGRPPRSARSDRRRSTGRTSAGSTRPSPQEEDEKATVIDPVERRVLPPGPHAEGREQPVPEPRRAGHGQARRQGLPHRAGQGRAISLTALGIIHRPQMGSCTTTR